MKENFADYKVLTLSESDDSLRWILTHPDLDDLELTALDVFIFNQLKLGKNKLEIDKLVMSEYGAVSDFARKKVENYIKTKVRSQKKIEEKVFSKKWRLIKSYKTFFLSHVTALMFLFLSPNYFEITKNILTEHKMEGLLFSIACVCLLSWLPWYVQSMVYGSMSRVKAEMKFTLVNLYPEFRYCYEKENRLSHEEKTQLSLVPLSIIAILFLVGSLLVHFTKSMQIFGGIIVINVLFRWVLASMPLRKPLFLSALSIYYERKDIIKSWEFLYDYFLPLNWKKKSFLNRDQEIQITISSLYMIFNIIVCICLIQSLLENKDIYRFERDFVAKSVLITLYIFYGIVVGVTLWKVVIQILKIFHRWFSFSFKEKYANIFFLFNFISLIIVFVLLILPNFIQLSCLIILSSGLFIFHLFILFNNLKFKIIKFENTVLLCNIIFLIGGFLSAKNEFILLSGVCFSYFYLRDPIQLFIVLGKNNNFKYCALSFALSGLCGLMSIAVYLSSISIFVIPFIATANILQSAAFIIRLKLNQNIDFSNIVINREKLRKKINDEEYLVIACKTMYSVLSKLFGKVYANNITKKSFILKMNVDILELQIKDLSKCIQHLDKKKSSGSIINDRIVLKLKPWMYCKKIDEILSYPAASAPWNKRPYIKYFMEGNNSPNENLINRKKIIKYLESHFLFTYFEMNQIKKISNYVEANYYNPRESVFMEGDLDEKLYLIVNGVFEVSKKEVDGHKKGIIELTKNDFIGEQSLLKHQFQNTTVSAKEKGLVLSLNARAFSSLIKKDLAMLRKYMKAIDDLWFIKSNTLFRGYSNESLSPIANAFKHKSFKMGQYVFKEGDIGDEFYIIRNGEVGVFLKRKSIPLALLSIGEFFGEIALLKNTPRTASIKTITETETLSLSRESLSRIMSDDLNLQRSLEFQSEQRLSKQG